MTAAGYDLLVATKDVTSIARDRRRNTLYSAPALDRAAALLYDLWTTGRRHGIDPHQWSYVASLGSEVLDVIDYRPYPDTPEMARRLCDQAFDELRANGISPMHLGLFGIALEPRRDGHPTPVTTYHPPGSRLVLGVDRDLGWTLHIDTPSKRVVGKILPIVAPFDDGGAAAAAVVVSVNVGDYGDTLFNQ